MNDYKFDTFEQFQERFPLNVVTIPVGIQPPDEEGDYWFIQLALPMKNKVVNCHVVNANQQHVFRYKILALKMFRAEIGLTAEAEENTNFKNKNRLETK